MKPLKLILEGFVGTRSHENGRISLDLTGIPESASLVALVGPNGSGKTTILENMQPYRIMPSRASTLSTGGFSYWDNISDTKAMKELEWEHGGKHYRSLLTFQVRGKTRKAEAFLYVKEKSDWEPVILNGTVSDGKTETYDRCVEGILGKPESFFTAQFSSQGRRLISDYGASEIKTLLASILSLDEYKVMAQKASDTARFLSLQINTLKDQSAKAMIAIRDQQQAENELENLDEQIGFCTKEKKVVGNLLLAARTDLARLEDRAEKQTQVLEQRKFLTSRIESVRKNLSVSEQEIFQQINADKSRLSAEEKQCRQDMIDIERSVQTINSQIQKDNALLARKWEIEKACAELPATEKTRADLERQLVQNRDTLKKLLPARSEMQKLNERIAEIKAKGLAERDRIIMLEKTASLIEKVPCRHQPKVSGCCPLLRQANEANIMLPQAKADKNQLLAEYHEIKKQLENAAIKVGQCDELEKQITDHEQQVRQLMKKESVLRELAILAPMLEDTRIRVGELANDLKLLNEKNQVVQEKIKAIRTSMDDLDKQQNRVLESLRKQASEEITSFEDQLAKLEKPISDQELEMARKRVEKCLSDENVCQTKIDSLASSRVKLLSTIETCARLRQESQSTLDEIARLEKEEAQFRLIEKGFGVNGLIALSIDDAGPEISTWCNQLLHDCFDGRFSVRLDTQKTLQNGNTRETFDVIVFDNLKGGEKALGMMSGGERVWVNECLTRAIALYVSGSSGTQFATLFTDEADGALDPDRKRQFMCMKRSILKLGGYEREYFVSQTPELWDMADYIIDVAKL